MSKYTVEHLGQEARESLDAVQERATTDPEFRQLALNDPHAAIREATGLEVPEDFKIKFFDGAGYDFAYALTDPAPAEGELSEEELAYAAGGQKAAGCWSWDDVCGQDGS